MSEMIIIKWILKKNDRFSLLTEYLPQDAVHWRPLVHKVTVLLGCTNVVIGRTVLPTVVYLKCTLVSFWLPFIIFCFFVSCF